MKKWIQPFNNRLTDGQYKGYLDEAEEILLNLYTPYKNKIAIKQLVIPLSGEFDSRLLISSAKQQNLKFISLVFGLKESNEYSI